MTHSTNFYYAILIATAVGATIFMVIVTLTHDQIFGQTVKDEDENAEQVANQGYLRGCCLRND